MTISNGYLRHLAVSQTLFPPTTLKRALHRLGFVQADPIRAPARAQDLILRHRVRGYRSGDLERRYPSLGVAEDFFLNYGFVTESVQRLMHPRSNSEVPAAGQLPWPAERVRRAEELLAFVRKRGLVHPRDVAEHFSHGTVRNYWGGSSNATTHLLDAMHYRGMLRVVRREAGIRVYAAHRHGPEPSDPTERQDRLDQLVDVAIGIYAPLSGPRLSALVHLLRFAAPQWRGELRAARERAKERLHHGRVDGIDWFWPAGTEAGLGKVSDAVRLLSPFDPVVWDRDRFERLWGWTYRFEAYTPASKRKLGYYALPLLWRDRVIGWGNLAVENGELEWEVGFIKAAPRERAFKRELGEELDRIRSFLGLA